MRPLSAGPRRPWGLSLIAVTFVLGSCSSDDRSGSGSERAGTFAPSLDEPARRLLQAAHPTDVLCDIECDEIPRGIRERFGLITVCEYEELDLVKYRATKGGTASDLAAALRALDEDATTHVDIRIETPEAAGMTVAFNDGRGSDADFEGQDLFAHLKVAEAHASRRGKKIVVAVIDTGIDPDHPVLDHRYKKGVDFIDGDKKPFEDADGIDDDGDGLIDEAYGHGTHIAGLVALMAPKAELRIYRVLTSEGHGSASDVAAAVEHARKKKVDVINLSLGMHADFEPLRVAIAAAEEQGIVVVASMGNEGLSGGVQFPAAYAEVIAVGSVDPLDNISVFSNLAPHMDAASPGEAVLSCAPGGGYMAWTGTSMSTGIVSGLVALLKEEHKKHGRSARVRDIIERSGVAIIGLPASFHARRVVFDRALEVD